MNSKAKKRKAKKVNKSFNLPLKHAKPIVKTNTTTPQVTKNNRAAMQRKLDTLSQNFKQAYKIQDYASALEFAKQAHQIIPNLVTPMSDIASCYVYMNKWENAIKWANKVVAIDANHINAHDVLAHAHGALKQQYQVKEYGLQALQLRNKKYGVTPKPLLSKHILPPPPSGSTKHQNIISFSLFGSLPKYCETAVLNAQVANGCYSNWTCWFYVDDTVPDHVKNRIEACGAKVIEVSEDDKKMPATLWRFLALDDASLHRVIFRDADSLVGEAEALAVKEWVVSDKYFHMMRDAATHTELVLAGMWGAVVGTLTQTQSFNAQITDFMNGFTSKNTHFADQFFLRDTQWQTIKTSLIQHDSMFGFLDAKPFPIDDRPFGSHIGSNISNGIFATVTGKPDGELVSWQLSDKNGNYFCRYQTVSKDNKITVSLPKMMLKEIDDGTIKVHLD